MSGEYVPRRLAVKPGLTGLWQVSGRANLPWEESVRLDVRYVEHWPGLDHVVRRRHVRTEPGAARSGGRTRLAGLDFDGLTEPRPSGTPSAPPRGERRVATPDVDTAVRPADHPAPPVGTASLVVPDGMPLVWAARCAAELPPKRGHPLLVWSCQVRTNASTRPSARDRVSTAGRPRCASEASASAASFSG